MFAEQASIQTFLQRHWQRPLAQQGEPPAGRSALETSLDPRACGACHPRQLQDWGNSLHAHAMGPGLLGQLADMDPADRASHQDCLRCHAPLAEQADETAAWIAGSPIEAAPAQQGVPAGPLYDQGLICAACHVREWVVHGPPRIDGSGATVDGPHGGFKARDAFEDSGFCAACHQFDADGYALNGKLLENTYEEWRASPQAREGKSCQSCHMPERRHLWRGIHDPDTVRSGVTIRLDKPMTTDGSIAVRLSLSNSGVGHRFPTYVTPRVVMEAIQMDATGALIAETKQEHIIARQVSQDLSEELFDTRLAPGETAILDYRAPRHPRAATLSLRIQIEPDRFYRDFYQATLESGSTDKGAAHLRLALDSAEASVFTLYEKEIALP